HREVSGRGRRPACAIAHASGRGGRVHFQAGSSQDQGGACQETKRDSLQLSGTEPRLRSAQWETLQRRSRSARQSADKRISTSTTAVTIGRSSRFGRLERLHYGPDSVAGGHGSLDSYSGTTRHADVIEPY